jgi:hypothetical protein
MKRHRLVTPKTAVFILSAFFLFFLFRKNFSGFFSNFQEQGADYEKSPMARNDGDPLDRLSLEEDQLFINRIEHSSLNQAGFNVARSNELSLQRPIPDARHSRWASYILHSFIHFFNLFQQNSLISISH